MRFKIGLLCLCLASPLLADSPATEARLEFRHNKKGTDFRYNILVDRHTLKELDTAIYKGSYLGEVHASQMDPEAELQERTDSRTKEILEITSGMLGSIPEPRVGAHRPVRARVFDAEPEVGPIPEGLPSLAPSLLAVTDQLDVAQTALEAGEWEAGLVGMGELVPLMASLKNTPLKEETIPQVRERWNALKDRYFVDGLLAPQGKAPLVFTIQKDTRTGRVLRHFANLATARGLGVAPLTLLVAMDEYKGAVTAPLAQKFRAYLAGGPAEPVKAAVLEAIKGTTAWTRFSEMVGPMDPQMRTKVVGGLAAEILETRSLADPGGVLAAQLEAWLDAEATP